MAKKKQNKKPAPQKESKVSADVGVNEASSDDVLYNLLDAKIEIPIQVLRDKHIFIATPCYGGQIGEPYFRSMMRLAILCNKYDIQFTVSTLANESLITRGRNTLVSFFMEHPDATHLFFVDADVEFDPNDMLRMVAYDRDVVVGAYPKKAINWNSIVDAARNNPEENEHTIEGHSSNYVVNFDFLQDDKGKPQPQIQIRDNLIKLKDAGTGFMCIKKEVIQKMFDKHPDLKYANDINVDQKFEPHMYALFDCIIDPESRRYLSEDYTFCRRWQEMGGEVFLDPRTALNHVGHYTFRGNIRKLITG
tara:strand:+ start:2789 stop:3706 length:918 start_codon:yes stop_codon:yes gene_type:complete